MFWQDITVPSWHRVENHNRKCFISATASQALFCRCYDPRVPQGKLQGEFCLQLLSKCRAAYRLMAEEQPKKAGWQTNPNIPSTTDYQNLLGDKCQKDYSQSMLESSSNSPSVLETASDPQDLKATSGLILHGFVQYPFELPPSFGPRSPSTGIVPLPRNTECVWFAGF